MESPDRSIRARRAGLASAASRTPEERSESAGRASAARWAKWRAEHGVESAGESSTTRPPADGLDAYLDEVLLEHRDWTFAQARREASIRQRKAAADLAWEALQAAQAAAAPRLPALPERDEDDE